MLGDLGADEDIDAAEEVPVRVQSEALRHILEWCEHHRGDLPVPEEESEDDQHDRRHAEVSDWDKHFLAERGYTQENRDKFEALLLVSRT